MISETWATEKVSSTALFYEISCDNLGTVLVLNDKNVRSTSCNVILCIVFVNLFSFSETVLFLHQIFLKGLMARMENWPTLVLGKLKVLCTLPGRNETHSHYSFVKTVITLVLYTRERFQFFVGRFLISFKFLVWFDCRKANHEFLANQKPIDDFFCLITLIRKFKMFVYILDILNIFKVPFVIFDHPCTTNE